MGVFRAWRDLSVDELINIETMNITVLSGDLLAERYPLDQSLIFTYRKFQGEGLAQRFYEPEY